MLKFIQLLLVEPKKSMGFASSVILILVACALQVDSLAQGVPDISLDDRSIAAIFLQVNDIDIENARFLQKSSIDSEVVKIPRMILNEHVPIRNSFMNLLRTLKIQPVLPKVYGGYWGEKQFRKHLKSTSGKEADRLYIDYEYAFSRQVIDLMARELIPACSNVHLRKFLIEVLPKMERHLAHISMYREMPGGGHEVEMRPHQH